MESDDFGDWRIAVVTTLTSDITAAFPGGPSHKVGTPVYVSSLCKDAQHNAIGFVTPSATALVLNAAIRSPLKAKELRRTIALTDTITPIGSGKQVATENLTHLYDFFEYCMTSVICSFQALEMFCNDSIARSCASNYMLQKGEGLLVLSCDEFERKASTEEKIGEIVPSLLKTSSLKGTNLWQRFLDLKTVRDSTIHFKSTEPLNTYQADAESLFFQFFRRSPTEYPVSIIPTNYPVGQFQPSVGFSH